MYKQRSLLGTPKKCEDIARKLQRIGVDEIACLVDFGMDFDTVLEDMPRVVELAQTRTGAPVQSTPASVYYGRG